LVDGFQDKVSFIWSVADLLRGDYKQSEYGKVILPLTVLRRLDSVLEPTKAEVLKRYEELKGKLDQERMGPLLTRGLGHDFFNVSAFTFRTLLDDPQNLGDNLHGYILGFDQGTQDVIAKFEFEAQIRRLERSNLLYKVVSKFCDIDLHPDRVSNLQMGYVYEELIRRFSELSNETAGEHFTPREVIRLMVNLLFANDSDLLTKSGVIKTIYDPACGTGGMLSVAEDHLRELNPDARLRVYGQELNAETYAVCRSDMMLKGQDDSNIYFGNSFTEDGAEGTRFDYLLANPPFGVEWKKVEERIRDEHQKQGYQGRFGAGLPRINDGSLLFLQHMLSKMKPPEEGGSRLAIVFNASPLFTGGAGSGESEIRRWIIENDWLEGIVGLPDQIFYNTGISTYFWVLTNRKSPERRGRVQLVDARELWTKMRKSLGEKRKTITDEQIAEITQLYADFTEGERCRVFDNRDFGFRRITVERPLRVRWEVTDETLASLRASKAVQKLDEEVQEKVVAAVEGLRGTSTTERETFVEKVHGALAELAKKPLEKAVLDAATVRDPEAPTVTGKKGEPEPDPELRDYENVPLAEDVDEYVRREVLPFVPDAWIDESKTKIGYEIPFTRHFYKYVPPRPLEEIDAEIKALEQEILELLREVTE
jgi:type I restriction enzyme M protein